MSDLFLTNWFHSLINRCNIDVLEGPDGFHDRTIVFSISGNFVDGLAEGEHKLVDTDSITYLCNFSKGLRHGKYSVVDNEGSVLSLSNWVNGVMIGYELSIDNGKVVHMIKYNGTKIDRVEYYNNGSLARINHWDLPKNTCSHNDTELTVVIDNVTKFRLNGNIKVNKKIYAIEGYKSSTYENNRLTLVF